MKRRAIHRLRREQPRQARDLAATEKLVEADIATHNVATRASGDDDVIGRLELEILPKLIGQRLRPLQEERLPVVTGVEDRRGLALCFVAGVLTRSKNELDFGAVSAHLHRLVPR